MYEPTADVSCERCVWVCNVYMLPRPCCSCSARLHSISFSAASPLSRSSWTGINITDLKNPGPIQGIKIPFSHCFAFSYKVRIWKRGEENLSLKLLAHAVKALVFARDADPCQFNLMDPEPRKTLSVTIFSISFV